MTLGQKGDGTAMMLVRDEDPTVHVVGPETPLKDVARLLVDERISGVPVVDSRAAWSGWSRRPTS